jgi:hypothetical protein
VLHEVDSEDIQYEAIRGGHVAHERPEKTVRALFNELKRKVSAMLRAGHLVRPA